MKRPYQAAFALAYAAHWEDFAKRASRGIHTLLLGEGIRCGRIVDLGCGTGVLAARLSRAGYSVVGIDASPEMLALAKARAPKAEFRRADLRTAAIPRCDAVTCTFDTLNYLPDAKALRSVFRRVARALEPGAVFLFDLVEPSDLLAGPPVKSLVKKGKDFMAVLNIRRFYAKRLKRYEVAGFLKKGTSWVRQDEVHVQRIYESEDVDTWLNEAGLTAERIPRYPFTEVEGGRVTWIARLRGSASRD